MISNKRSRKSSAVTALSLMTILVAHGIAITQAKPEAMIADDATDKLVYLMNTLAAKERNPLLRRHFESIARFATDTSHGVSITEQDNETAADVQRFFESEGAKWETYASGPRPLIMSFKSATDGKYSYYWLFLPKNYDVKKVDYPFYFELHGSGGGSNNNPRKMVYLALQPEVKGVAAQGYRREGFYVYPWGRGDKGYRDIAEKDVLEVLADFDTMFKTDPARQYIYGFSMGAAGTLRLAQLTSGRWAAIAAYSGSMNNPTAENMEKLGTLPVWLAWGELETRLTDANTTLEKLLLETGHEVKTTIIKDVGHRYLGEYQEAMLDWLNTHQKKK